jgi:hypothetical protein
MEISQDQPLNPATSDCGDFDIRITADGVWHYRGSPIGRMALVRLFASVLKRDERGQFWLETPAERGRNQVDDAPFVAVELQVEGAGREQRLRFRTNIDEMVTADPHHPIHLRRGPRVAASGDDGEAGRPYIRLREGIEALIARPVYYALVELADEQLISGRPQPGVWSCGTFFPLVPILTDEPRQAHLP